MTDDVMNRLRYYQTTGQADQAKNYEAYLRQTGQWKEPDVGVGDYARAAGMGLSLGTLDELTGGLAAIVPGGKGYTEARDEVRNKYDAATKLAPKRMLAAEIAGSLPTMFATGGAGTAARGAGVLAKAGSAALSGGLLGAASGAGHSTAGDASGVAKDALIGGGIGAGAGGILSGLGSIVGKVGGRVMDAFDPTRAVVREAATQLPANAAATLARQEAMAPGTAVLADISPEMQALTRGVGADARTGVEMRLGAESREAALKTARKEIGAQYDALNQAVPIDKALRTILGKAGKQSALPKGAADVELSAVIKARSRLLAEARATKNKAVAHDKNEQAAEITKWATQHAPNVAELDKAYAFIVDRIKAASGTTKEVANSSKNYAANRVYGAEAGSVGGSLPTGSRGIAEMVSSLLAPDRAARARAVSDMLLTPGDATSKALAAITKARGRMNAPPSKMSRAALAGLLSGSTVGAGHAQGLLSP
jgi:hypothetical protein